MWQGRIDTPFVTPSDNPPGTVTRRILLPGNEGFMQLVTGALAQLLIPENFTETPGGLTIEQTVQRFHEMFTTYLENEAPTVSIPIGTILPHMITTALPVGWLICDGAEYDAVDYPDLYAVLPPELQSGSTFNVPDLRLRVPVGQAGTGDGYGVYLGQGGGSQTHTLTTAEMPAHNHAQAQHRHANSPITAGGQSMNIPTRDSVATWTGGTGYPARHNNVNSNGNLAVTIPSQLINVADSGYAQPAIENAGGGGAHNNLQPFLLVNYAIVALGG